MVAIWYVLGMGTHNYRRTREHRTIVASWIRTYRNSVVKQGDVDPGEVQQGGVPIL